jgi:hypothetical protein
MKSGYAAIIAVAASLVLAGCQTTGNSSDGDKFVRVNTSSLPAQAEASAQADTPLARALLDEVNAFRKSKGAGPLSVDPCLQKAAAVHSQDMALRDFFGHFNPDDQGPKERVLAVDEDYKGSLAENIVFVQGPEKAFHQMAQQPRTSAEHAGSELHHHRHGGGALRRQGLCNRGLRRALSPCIYA